MIDATTSLLFTREVVGVVIRSGEELFDIISGWNLRRFSAVYDT
jgi:hypothetical protein